jgi:hypothetical protein
MTRKRANSLKRSTLILSLCLLISSCSPNSPALVPPETRGTGDQFGIIGQAVDRNSNPATGAYIYAYRNMRSNLRGPADFEALVDAKGLYFLDMVEGDYYLVARMRQSGADAGPPKAGDAWALPTKNPVSVKPGETSTVNFVLQGISQPMLMREGTLTSGDTGFTGLLVDSNDKPLTGAFAIAYPDADYQRMPEATSPAVGDDGRFQLYVERPGQWCLAARTRTRGQPIAGEPYGKLGLQESGCRNVVAGKIIDVGTIRLTPYSQ